MWEDPTLRAAILTGIGTVSLAIAGAVGYITKRLCTGISFYVGKLYGLLETLANKHMKFMDEISQVQKEQSDSLTKIETSATKIETATASTSEAFRKMGSDPTKLLTALKDEMVQEVMEHMAKGGNPCRDDVAEIVVEQHLKKKGQK